jgi:MFS family permease
MNKQRLFVACSLALVVTAFTFAIRANFMGVLAAEFNLSAKEIGEVASAAFWGFTIAMFAGGPLCDGVGLGKMYLLAFTGHIFGILLTIFSIGYWSLFFSTLLVGLANGFIESASYTLVSSMYSSNKAKRINDWHIWFPGGIAIGGLLVYLLSLLNLGWKIQMAVIMLPTMIYGLLFYKQEFPKSERITLGISNRQMIKECFRPLFIFMLICMLLTAATELGTNQWIAALLSNVGIPSILLLVFINGIMAIGRANAGFVLKRLSSTGLLLFSAIFSFAGLFWLGFANGYAAFAAAGVFAVGICFFWPTMIGFVSENLYKTGPLGLSLMGGTGLLSTAIVLPFMGQLYSSQVSLAKMQLAKSSLPAGDLIRAAELAGGAHTLRYVSVLPAILIVLFSILHFTKRKTDRSGKQTAVLASV